MVAAGLRAAIASGQIPVGARLPPQRKLAQLLGVGRRTIVEAFNLLRAESPIRSRRAWAPGSSGGPTLRPDAVRVDRRMWIGSSPQSVLRSR
jgi:DNA-binding transcriptional MocR family regulator